MHTIQVRNVHRALPEGLRYLEESGRKSPSRAGDVYVSPTPVMTVYEKPNERVVFWAERNANPFFHLMEALWMLAGRNDVAWLARFNKRMETFSDDGKTFHGAYGHRWREYFERWDEGTKRIDILDQLERVIQLFRNNPQTRRAVIQMWDCEVDLYSKEQGAPKDIPCNDLIMLANQDGALDLTVLCRSNDIIWGAYGANAVHFSVLHEYLAARIGFHIGRMYQFSNNYHAYEDTFKQCESLIDAAADPYRSRKLCPYAAGDAVAMDLFTDPDHFDDELYRFMETEDIIFDELKNPFFKYASALKTAYLMQKSGDLKDLRGALDIVTIHGGPITGSKAMWDFQLACLQWVQRKIDKKESV